MPLDNGLSDSHVEHTAWYKQRHTSPGHLEQRDQGQNAMEAENSGELSMNFRSPSVSRSEYAQLRLSLLRGSSYLSHYPPALVRTLAM
jgi:hypothetical protein